MVVVVVGVVLAKLYFSYHATHNVLVTFFWFTWLFPLIKYFV